MRTRNRSNLENAAIFGLGCFGAYAGWQLLQRTRVEVRNKNLQRGKRIIVLGAGFGGREAALELTKQFPGSADAEIILVDQEPFLLFTPMLTEAAGSELDPDHIVSPATQLPGRINFIQARVEAVDLQRRSVTLLLGRPEENIPEGRRTIEADHLVLALGSVSNFHGVPGLEENSITMKQLEDAAFLRGRVLELLHRADDEPDAQRRKELLTIVVGGAGLTGVETMAAINDFIRESAGKFPSIDPQEIQTILVDPGQRILPELNPALGDYAQEELERRNVQVRLNTKITGAGEDYVEFDGHERIKTRTLIWAGGVTPNPLMSVLQCAHGKHRAVMVDHHLAVPGFPGVWALGDSAQVPTPKGGYYSPTAQNAVREGRVVGRNIAAALRGEPLEQFEYEPLGELALVGRHSGVARILGFQFKGIVAWALWRMIYWSKMPSSTQKMRILSDWMLDLVLGRNMAPLLLSKKQRAPHKIEPSMEPAMAATSH